MNGDDQPEMGVSQTVHDILFDRLRSLVGGQSAALVVRSVLGPLDSSEAEMILQAVLERLFPDDSLAGVATSLTRVGRDDRFDDHLERLKAE